MTDDERDDDLAHPEFADEHTRAEREWLIARESDPHAPPPSPELAAEYAHLESLLASPPADLRDDDDSWQAEVFRHAREMAEAAPAARRPWWRRAATRWIVTSAAFVAIIALVFVRPPPPAPLDLAFEILHSGTKRADPTIAVVGDELLTSKLSRGDTDLRLYRPDGSLAARCPDGPACTNARIDVELEVAGRYSLLLVIGTTQLPLDVALDKMVGQAGAANATVQLKTFEVR